MRVPVTLAALAVVFAVTSAQQQNQFVGKWEITGTGPDTREIYFLDVVDKGGQLEAKFLDKSAHATPVPWIRVENGELVWQKGNGSDTLPKPSCGPIYRAKLEGGKLVGSHVTPGEPCPQVARGGGAGRRAEGGGATPPQANAVPNTPPPAPPAPPKAPPTPRTINWVGVKQPVFKPANANGNHTYGSPVVIVGAGVGKETWSGLTADTWQNRCADRWTATDGVLKNAVAPTQDAQGNPIPPAQREPSTCNIFTKEKFQDFKAEMDFVLDTGQNSGFYLRGRHELQLSLGMNPNSSYPGQLLDIYGWTRTNPAPVPNPPGALQSLTVVVVGNHVTATFNGKKVHDNAVLYAWTGGALDNKEDQPGPIMIQGDHSLITIKKLVITPITKAGM